MSNAFARAASVAWIVAISSGSSLRAANSEPQPLKSTGGSYCGVYSLFAAAVALDRRIPFDDLLQEKYIGNKTGSSLEELESAAKDHGLHCRAMRSLTPGALRAADCPILLHVRRPGKGTPFNHWLLFLGMDESGRLARIVDPPSEMTAVPLDEICALWDGVGLLVSDRPERLHSPQWGSWFNQLLSFAFVGSFVGLAIVLVASTRPTIRIGSLFVLVMAASGIWHSIHPDGMFGKRAAIAQVAGRHFMLDLHEVDEGEVAASLREPGVTILDARTPDAFRSDHLPGAINVPVFANIAQRDRLLREIPNGQHLIVYCQNEQCPWAEAIGGDLSLRGYRVSIFRRGYDGWREHHRDR